LHGLVWRRSVPADALLGTDDDVVEEEHVAQLALVAGQLHDGAEAGQVPLVLWLKHTHKQCSDSSLTFHTAYAIMCLFITQLMHKEY
jgi:hypothetical protein